MGILSSNPVNGLPRTKRHQLSTGTPETDVRERDRLVLTPDSPEDTENSFRTPPSCQSHVNFTVIGSVDVHTHCPTLRPVVPVDGVSTLLYPPRL